MNLRHIEIILAIEAAGSLRGAAKVLGRTQPALTKALRQAEADLGMAIFERSPSGVVPTEQGRAVLRRGRIIQAELRRMQDDVRQMQGQLDGQLRITVSPLAAARFVPAALRRFQKRFPRVHVQISGGHEPMAFGPLRSGDVDFVIGPAPQGTGANGLSVAEIVRTPIAIVTGLGSCHANATSVVDLLDAKWIMIGPRERQPIVAGYLREMGLEPPIPVINSDSILSILTMLKGSDLVCTFPTLLLDEIEPIWPIRRIPIAETFDLVSIAITHSSDSPLTSAGQYFRDCVLAVAEEFDRLQRDNQK
ncbi:LysR family transcriptional regulator [Nioella aestuarii]|uniref:LysR family transcriptional regulator n=1 Tax=Nioella aestuarii TaxID=1662864 RepID=UPI003D7F59F4